MKRITLGLMLLLLSGLPLLAQSASKTLDRIARDQLNIKQRLDRINEKMDRLVKKNELEGRRHTADLIRRARAAIRDRNIVKRVEDLDVRIRAAQLTVDEEQRLLLQDLEDIFAILQDRNDLERVQDLIASVMEGMKKIDGLIKEQDQLLEETRELSTDTSYRLTEDLERLNEIVDEQQSLADRTERLKEEAARQEQEKPSANPAETGEQEESEPEAGDREESSDQQQERTEAQTKRLAAQQDLLEAKMRDLRERMERSGKKPPQTGSPDEQAQRKQAEEALQRMDQAQERLEKGEVAKAFEEQQAALDALRRMEQKMQEAQQREQASAEERNASSAQRSQKLKEMAALQKKLEERTRDLMRRLRELPDPKMKQELSDAADNMAGASTALQEERADEAQTDQEEARKHLEKAMKDLAREETKYENIRQQEVLFRVRQALEAVKAEQDAINGETADFDGIRDPIKRLNRLQRKTLRELARREQDVGVKAMEIKEKLEEDEATVFSWVLERNVQDLEEIADYLNRQQTGILVQSIQQEVSDRFGELIETMKLEMKRRSEAMEQSSEQPPDQQQQKNPLIPPVAELLMIKRLEENALHRLTEFVRMNPELLEKGAGPMEIQMLERLGHRHANITELFTKMVDRGGGGPMSPEPPSEDE